MAPENKKIRGLLVKASRGIKFIRIEGKIIEDVKPLKPFERMIRFIEVLNNLAGHKNIKV